MDTKKDLVPANYEEMATKLSFDVDGMVIHHSALQTKDEDETNVLEFEHKFCPLLRTESEYC